MKWMDGSHQDYSPKDIYVAGDGSVALDTRKCNCVGWDEVGHEPYCGLEHLGTMDGSWSEDPTMLWSMAWDFTQI